MRKLACLVSVLLVGIALGENILEMPMDTLDYIVVGGDMTATVVTEGDRTFVRFQPLEDNDWPDGWFYWPRFDLTAANGGERIDASVEGSTLEFDVRYYQEDVIGDNGVGPYENANIGIQVKSRDPNDVQGEMWLGGYFKVGVSPPDDPPEGNEWYHLVVDLHQGVGDLDLQYVWKMELHGGYGRNVPEDFFDVDNLVITPEPSTLGLLAIGLLGLTRRR